MTRHLPASPAALAAASWDEIKRFYDDLADRELSTDTAAEWLADWSRLEELWREALARAEYDYNRDTRDAELERVYLRCSSEIEPLVQEQRVRLANRLIASGYNPPELAEVLRRFRVDAGLFRPENVAVQAELEKLNSEVFKLTGSFTVEWEGESIPLPQLAPFVSSPDREVRERAWRLSYQPYLDSREDLSRLFSSQLERRQQLARNTGLANYRDYMHRAKYREYSVDDCLRFDAAVEEVIVPAASRIWERRRARMGLDTLRPWDTDCDAFGLPPLRPYEDGAELVSRAAAVFEGLDPTLGGYFRTMAEEDLLDLESRPGKVPGAFSANLPHSRRSVIFMNGANIAEDVKITLHEAGHSFHAFEVFKTQDLVFQHEPGEEMCEVASMSMELLAAPHLRRVDGGFYAEADYRRARIEHLESILTFFPHYAVVDGFQQWVYTDPAGADPDARDAYWLQLRSRLEPAIDYSGLTAERIARWYRQIHIFILPFYYIEYGIAQMGALQVWRNSRTDERATVAAYRRALGLGASKPLAELYKAAGIRLAFDAATMRELVDVVEEELAGLAG